MPGILHASDLHFGPPFLADRAEALLELERRLTPDLVVLSGDLTQRAKIRQFTAASEYVRRFRGPLVVTCGNHDVPLYRVWERFLTPHRNYRRYIHDRLNYAHTQPGLTVVSLNSSRSFTFTNGRLRTSQLRFAERTFAEAPPGDLRIVVTHHPLAPPPLPDTEVATGWRRALRVLSRLDVDVVLAGHKHRAFVGHSADWVAGPPPGRDVPLVHAGTATSCRGRGAERGRNTVNFVLADKREMRITRYMWQPADNAFQEHGERLLVQRGAPMPEERAVPSP